MIESRDIQRNRHFYRQLFNFCPPQLAFGAVPAFVNGDDLFSIDQVLDGVQCQDRDLFRLGLWFRKWQSQTQREHAIDHRLTYYSAERQNREFTERNRRAQLIQQRVDAKCRMAVTNDSVLERIYQGDVGALSSR